MSPREHGPKVYAENTEDRSAEKKFEGAGSAVGSITIFSND